MDYGERPGSSPSLTPRDAPLCKVASTSGHRTADPNRNPHFTDRVARKVMQSPPSVPPSVRLSVRPSVSTLYFEPLALIFACVWVTTMARRRLKLKVTGQGQDAVGLTSILDRGQFSSRKNRRELELQCRKDEKTKPNLPNHESSFLSLV